MTAQQSKSKQPGLQATHNPFFCWQSKADAQAALKTLTYVSSGTLMKTYPIIVAPQMQ